MYSVSALMTMYRRTTLSKYIFTFLFLLEGHHKLIHTFLVVVDFICSYLKCLSNFSFEKMIQSKNFIQKYFLESRERENVSKNVKNVFTSIHKHIAVVFSLQMDDVTVEKDRLLATTEYNIRNQNCIQNSKLFILCIKYNVQFR